MSINSNQFREYIIQPTLKHIGLYSKSAENLLFLTAAQESGLGTYLHQMGRGPACGPFEMEPATHDDIWLNFIKYKKELFNLMSELTLKGERFTTEAEEMCGNMYYAAAMCRVHYLRVKEPLPYEDDINGLATYWKQYYNTPQGAGTVDQAIKNYRRYDE